MHALSICRNTYVCHNGRFTVYAAHRMCEIYMKTYVSSLPCHHGQECTIVTCVCDNGATHSATHCNTLCNTLQRTLQHTATHSATHCNTLCNTLQHTLQHTAKDICLDVFKTCVSSCIYGHILCAFYTINLPLCHAYVFLHKEYARYICLGGYMS